VDDPTVMPRWGKVGKQRIVDEGPLAPFPNMAGLQNWQESRKAKYDMETFDEVLVENSKRFMDQAKKDGRPFFIWHNTTRMHVATYLAPKYQALVNYKSNYGLEEAGMAQMDDDIGDLLQHLQDIGVADNTIVIFTTGAEVFTWPDGGMVALMMSVADSPLFLQVKQANASVLEAYAGKSVYAQHGERVVQGQRLMQPASDLFLGWVIGPVGRHFYIRQLRDVKLSPLVETYDAEMLSIYGQACGWVLARAHAKAGDPWAISGYLGKNAQFDEAMGKFALVYADQAERDHAALKAAVRAGIVEVQLEH
jgi:hypothetical protein